ncbi:MAG: NAD(P)-dependent oxidoreductase [Clostridia bacterium]|nr:NAD(P)-dependent oxidoreductase [Clostridia bacterium]
MKILITGGNGYLGQRIVKELNYKGHEIVLLILNNSNTEMFKNLKNISFLSTSDEDIKKACTQQIDVILHLATSYGRCKEGSEKVVQSNYLFPLKILENAINNNIKYFFNMDTAIQKLVNEYAITKKQFKEWGYYYGEQGKIRFINMKSEHFYGPFDNNVKFIANMLNKLKSNTPYIETTLGEQERAFIYIDDLVQAILYIIEYEIKNKKLEFTEYEIGPDNNTKIKDVLLIMKKLTKSQSDIKFGAIPYRKNEEMKSECDNSKLKSLGWSQTVLRFEDGIKKILMEEGKK